MIKLLLAAVGLVCLAGPCLMASPVDEDGPLNQMHWQLYKRAFGKVYSDPEEEAMRRSLFLETRRSVEQHNAELADQLGYEMGYSHLSDWTTDELLNMMGSNNTVNDHLQRYSASEQERRQKYEMPEVMTSMLRDNLVGDLPKQVDWRYRVPTVVSDVKDQGKCASSYAFAASGALEAIQFQATERKELVPLSAQNLIDCVISIGLHNERCRGGFAHLSIVDVVRQQGIMSEKDYPYIDSKTDPKSGLKHKCQFNSTKQVMQADWYYPLEPQEELMQLVVAAHGPVAATIHASPALASYKSGIFSDPKCKNEPPKVTHSVLVVGYGVDAKHGDYWIVKNSWGTDWGEDGYFRLARNKSNMCGIVTLASVAVAN